MGKIFITMQEFILKAHPQGCTGAMVSPLGMPHSHSLSRGGIASAVLFTVAVIIIIYYFKLNTTQGSLITGEPYHLRKFRELITEAQTIPTFRSIK